MLLLPYEAAQDLNDLAHLMNLSLEPWHAGCALRVCLLPPPLKILSPRRHERSWMESELSLATATVQAGGFCVKGNHWF